MVTNESLVQSAVAQYHSDEDFRRFVDSIRARMQVEQGVLVSPEALLGQETQTGVPMAVLLYKRYRATQIV